MRTLWSRRKAPITHVSLTEFVKTGTPLRVDRDKGIIHGVKVLGPDSANGRRYPPETWKKAARLYEGAKVYADHPLKPGQARSVRDVLGRLHGVEVREDGLYANLHVLTAHELGESVLEDAEKGLGAFGLSHNAEGDGERRDGIFVVTEITAVHSVDLVTEPATVSSLAESKGQPMSKTTARAVLEALLPKLPAGRQPVLRAFLEADEVPADAPMDAPPADASSDDQTKAAFRQMVVAAFDDESLDMQATLKKIKDILMSYDKLTAKAEEPAPESKGKEESRRQQPDPAMQALQERVEKAELKDWIREECERLGATWDRALEEGLLAIKDRAAITRHLEWLNTIRVKRPAGPRSQEQGRRLAEEKIPTESKDLGRWLTTAGN